jgi:phosphate transport system substrate-binding protein
MKKIKTSTRMLVVISSCIACIALIASTGCSRRSHKAITLAGSTAFQPFAEKIAEKFMAVNPEIQVNVQGGGSAVGIQSALSGAADIGMVDLLNLPKETKSLESTTVAKDGIAIVVNPKNPVNDLSAEQAKDIFSGKITNWSAVGGPASPIRVVSREEGSGTRSSFDALVLGKEKIASNALFQDSNGTVRETVAGDPDAIGYVSIGLVNERVKAVSYNGHNPTNDNVKRGVYALARPIFFLYRGQPNEYVKTFLDFVISAPSQNMLKEEGLVPRSDFR